MKVLVVVDMQNDFVDGALGTKEACAIVPDVVKMIEGFDGKIVATRDTHMENYMDSQEGKTSSGHPLCERNRRVEDQQ